MRLTINRLIKLLMWENRFSQKQVKEWIKEVIDSEVQKRIVYIRFGEIPENMKSGIYRGDWGKIGEEAGVSVYEAINTGSEYKIIIPKIQTVSIMYTIEGMLREVETGVRKIYLVDGICIGHGSDNEPVLAFVKIKKELVVYEGSLINKKIIN